MEFKTYPTIIRFFSICCFFLSYNGTLACGWSETPEISRLALFRAERSDFSRFGPFCYSADTFATTVLVSDKDQKLNCIEWQKKLSNDINPDDVYTILYETDSEVFQSAYQTKSLEVVFKGNTFIKKLVLSRNKAFLEYLIFAKKLEYNNYIGGSKWESWNNMKYGYSYSENGKNNAFLGDYNNKFFATKDAFLKQRYAFLILRLNYYEENPQEVIRLYDTYFTGNQHTILAPWALYFKAISTENRAFQNYLLSKVFVSCEEKTFAVMQHYQRGLTVETLSYVQNDAERATILAIESMRNPAPELLTLKKIHALDSDGSCFNFLIGREVNKLEDWIFTPKYTQSGPSVQFDQEEWYQDYEKAKSKNLIKDIGYLRELRTFLITIADKATVDQKDFLFSAIAQLYFIDDQVDLGKKYIDLISTKANASIVLQSNIQRALVALKQNNIETIETKQILFDCFNTIENTVEEDNSLFKSMYSLYRIVSDKYAQKGDQATAGLLFMKSNNKNGNSSTWGFNPYFYSYLGYFDRFATIKDMDNLIVLLQKKDKTPFEKYICAGTIAQDVNVYKDLKGTIAFRKNDLELAYATFAEMPTDFWKKNYEYKKYLNENPFFPKVLENSKKRNFEYRFNKAEFVKTLIDLRKENTAKSNLKLAHAYFNVSYLGNSWMMNSYDWSSGGDSYSDYIFGGDRNEREAKYQNGNYYKCSLAKMYYKKALMQSKNKEEKALASLMIFECDYVNSDSWVMVSGLENLKFVPGKEIYNFNTLYRNTKTFQQYNCPLLQSFIN